MNLPSGWELILVVLVIMVLFGAKRLPEASRSLGRSLRIFKAETKGLRDDDDATSIRQGSEPGLVAPAVVAATASPAPTPVPAPAPIAPPAPVEPPAPIDASVTGTEPPRQP